MSDTAREEAERRHALGELYDLSKSRLTTFVEGAEWQASQQPAPEDVSDDLLRIIKECGLDEPGFTPHSWRCDNPDRYPDYCTCARDMRDAILAVFDVRRKP